MNLGSATQTETKMLRFYLRALGAEAAEAEDIAQEALLIALEKDIALDPSARAAWLRSTARRIFLQVAKKDARRRQILEDDAAEDLWQRLVPKDDLASLKTALKDCVEALAPRARRLVLGFHTEGLLQSELARLHEMSVSAVETALSRARQALAHCLRGRNER